MQKPPKNPQLPRRTVLAGGALVTGSLLGMSAPFSHAFAEDAAPVVETTSGRVRGAVSNGVNIFKGIHYGARTDGPGRFMPPAKPKPWIGIRDALEFGPPCPQLQGVPLLSPKPGALPPTENCLALNVWTPGLGDGAKRPVMVWVHFTIAGGDAAFSWSDGENLSRTGDVVMVSFNHRLNIFGHLYLGDLGGGKYAESGNVGLLDAVAALQWVRDNITAFGGDPDNVTIFGESDGGAKISNILAMPSAKGLFHKAIVQSGAKLRAVPKDRAMETTAAVLSKLGLKSSDVDLLQTLPADELLLAMKSVSAMKNENGFAFQFRPVVDGLVLPHHPFDPVAPQVSVDVPLLVGSTNTETASDFVHDDANFSLDAAALRAKIAKVLEIDDHQAEALIAAYRKAQPDAASIDLLLAITTDRRTRMNGITQAELRIAARSAPTFMYVFSWKTPVNGGKMRSYHGVDLTFVFNNLGAASDFTGTGADRQALADLTSGAWTAFARTGNPNHEGLPRWPAYTLKDRETMIFDNHCQVVNDPGKEGRLAQRALPPVAF